MYFGEMIILRPTGLYSSEPLFSGEIGETLIFILITAVCACLPAAAAFRAEKKNLAAGCLGLGLAGAAFFIPWIVAVILVVRNVSFKKKSSVPELVNMGRIYGAMLTVLGLIFLAMGIRSYSSIMGQIYEEVLGGVISSAITTSIGICLIGVVIGIIFVGVLTIDREKALNALNSEVLADLDAALDAIDLDSTRCLIITGAGQKSFVAGADIGEMSTLTKAEGEAFGKKGNDVFRKIETLPIPVIAAVNGFALGGGCELSLSCDIRLAAENAVFGQPETGLGITPGFGGTQRLARTINVGKAKEMISAGTKVKAPEALSLGLVSAVYPAEELMPAAMKLAERISANAPIAVRACKKAINDGLQVNMDEAIVIEEKLFGSCFETEDQKNGMTAFVEKRKPEPFINK